MGAGQGKAEPSSAAGAQNISAGAVPAAKAAAVAAAGDERDTGNVAIVTGKGKEGGKSQEVEVGVVENTNPSTMGRSLGYHPLKKKEKRKRRRRRDLIITNPVDECKIEQFEYQHCQNRWYREKFLAGTIEGSEECADLFEDFRDCVTLATERMALQQQAKAEREKEAQAKKNDG